MSKLNPFFVSAEDDSEVGRKTASRPKKKPPLRGRAGARYYNKVLRPRDKRALVERLTNEINGIRKRPVRNLSKYYLKAAMLRKDLITSLARHKRMESKALKKKFADEKKRLWRTHEEPRVREDFSRRYKEAFKRLDKKYTEKGYSKLDAIQSKLKSLGIDLPSLVGTEEFRYKSGENPKKKPTNLRRKDVDYGESWEGSKSRGKERQWPERKKQSPEKMKKQSPDEKKKRERVRGRRRGRVG